MSRTRRAPEWWYADTAVPPLMQALSWPYAAISGLRRRAYLSGWLRRTRIGVPVLVIGNLIAGGAGKTPLVIALCQRLRAAGRTPGVASRGYGRSDEAVAHWAEARSDPAQVGDEPVMIARNAQCPVRVDRDRVAGARALAQAGCDVVVCDDGLQHYPLARDIEIEVIDGGRRYGNGRLLPAGPLREPAARGAACEFRVVNLADAQAQARFDQASFGEWPMRLSPGAARPLRRGCERPLSTFSGQRVHAVAGIAEPRRFFEMLKAHGIAVVPHAFPDHHAFVASDLRFGSDLPLLMTEKDAVKCAAFAQEQHYSVPVQAQLPEAFWVALLDRLERLRGEPGTVALDNGP